jgi:SNF2 family DNA or RNA helicase
LHDDFVVGALVQWQEKLGVIVGLQADGDGELAEVDFDDGEHMFFKADSGQITRVVLGPGAQVMRPDGLVGVVLEQASQGDYPTWKVAFPGSVTAVVELGLRPAVIDDPLARMESGNLGQATALNLRSTAADYWLSNQYSDLVSLSHARVDLLPHQVSVVHRVVSRYPHRFLLCDEVGLGKTIEAAMIIKELRARKQISRVLILSPPGLQRQWQFELKTKFNERFAIYNKDTIRYLEQKGAENPWMDHDSIITSHSWASWTEERRSEIAAVPWDMIVVDEAHHARAQRYGNTVRRTNLYNLVAALIGQPESARRAVLLLTASPMQLEHHELYSLAEMLDPILFASEEDFVDHVQTLAGLSQLVERIDTYGLPEDPDERAELAEEVAVFLEADYERAQEALELPASELAELLRGRHRLSEVLIRNRKAVIGGFMPRHAARWEVDLTDAERRVQTLMDEILERGFQQQEHTGQNTVGFQMVMLQKLLASSSRALLTSLLGRRMRVRGDPQQAAVTADTAESDLDDDGTAADVLAALGGVWEESTQFDEVIAQLESIEIDSKTRVLVEQIQILFEEEKPDPKVLIFTEFRETQDMLARTLEPIASVSVFHGQMSAEQKDAAVAAFRDGRGPQVLVSTEAGGEGRNFQFCHILVNYDLPWNPMKVEQRIGRLDRIGQKQAVNVFNFHVKGTIEGRILEVLERRIKIFVDAVGSLDPILGEAEADIRNTLRLAREERDAAIERLGERLEQDIDAARAAEDKFADLIMDIRSYSAAIAQTVSQQAAPITPLEFELFLTQLLKSVNTYIGPREATGVRPIHFHPPFSVQHPELVQGEEARRVCFDPSAAIDSEHVEYLGFGHPIVDHLVTSVIEEKHEGAAARRRIAGEFASQLPPGWHFNWIVRIEGLRPKEFVFPVFVKDDGTADAELGTSLLTHSRKFELEHLAGTPDTTGLRQAHEVAQAIAFQRRDEELAEHQRETAERIRIEESRTRALYRRRLIAGEDRVAACRSTLDKLNHAVEPSRRAAIPLWEANLRRAEAEVEALRDDLERALMELERRRIPSGEVKLLNIARIEPDVQAFGGTEA